MDKSKIKTIAAFILLLLVISCSSLKQVPVKTDTIYRVVDSIAWHDTTVVNYITKEKVVDIVAVYDTLKMETSVASATSYIDTTSRTLKGSLVNKEVPIKSTIKWKERIITRDSIVTKEVPVEIVKEVTKYPKSYWVLLSFSIICVAMICMKLYFKFIK